MVRAPTGDILDEAGESPQIVIADLDIDALRAWRAEFPALRDVRADLLGTLTVDKSIQHHEANPTTR